MWACSLLFGSSAFHSLCMVVCLWPYVHNYRERHYVNVCALHVISMPTTDAVCTCVNVDIHV